jgi:hypothetical protein
LKEEIERYFQQLIGLRLTKTTRAAAMESLKFGHLLQVDKLGEEFEIGEFALHLQCPWRFTNDTKILVGSNDLFEPTHENAEFDESFDWDTPNGNLRDFKLHEIISTKDLIVNSIVADDYGGFELLFDSNIKLYVFPADSKVGEYSEFWRLLDNRPINKGHFVVSNSGVEHIV